MSQQSNDANYQNNKSSEYSNNTKTVSAVSNNTKTVAAVSKAADNHNSTNKENVATGNAFFQFRGRPLVRCGDTLYFGNSNDKYVAMLKVISSCKKYDINISTNVSVKLMQTNPNIPPQDVVVKQSEKPGLYAALDLADIWLNRVLK